MERQHTKLQNVGVIVRVRPCEAGNWAEDLKLEGRSVVTCGKRYEFEGVFGPSVSQNEVYERTVDPLVEGIFEGFNATVLAYGQTGSGKTYTMGTAYEDGIVQRSMQAILSRHETTNVGVSYLEIYNEELRDLLACQPTKLCVRERTDGAVFASGATEARVHSLDDMRWVLQRGTSKRATEGTACNATSSRSHAVITIGVETRSTSSPASATHSLEEVHELVRHSKLHCVDLAGSERTKRAGTHGQRFREGVHINAGLLALGKVISALAEGGHQHVPYRDSKLTRLLQDSLGGRSRTVMIACISADKCDSTETATTLAYASRTRHVANIVERNDATLVVSNSCDHPALLQLARAKREALDLRQGLERCLNQPSLSRRALRRLLDDEPLCVNEDKPDPNSVAARLTASQVGLEAAEGVPFTSPSGLVARAEAAEAAFGALRAERESDLTVIRARLDREIAVKEACMRELKDSEDEAKRAVEKYQRRLSDLERDTGLLREKVRDGLAVGAVDDSQQLRDVVKLGDCTNELSELRRQQRELLRVEQLRRESELKFHSLKEQTEQLKEERAELLCPEGEKPDVLEKKASRWLNKHVDEVLAAKCSPGETPAPYQALSKLEVDLSALAPFRQRAVLLEACRQLVASKISRREDHNALVLSKKITEKLRLERRNLKKQLQASHVQPSSSVREYEDKIQFLLRELKRHETASALTTPHVLTSCKPLVVEEVLPTPPIHRVEHSLLLHRQLPPPAAC